MDPIVIGPYIIPDNSLHNPFPKVPTKHQTDEHEKLNPGALPVA